MTFYGERYGEYSGSKLKYVDTVKMSSPAPSTIDPLWAPTCRNCSKALPTDPEPLYDFNKCDECPYVLCRACDDSTKLLRINPDSGIIHCKLCAKLYHEEKARRDFRDVISHEQ